MLKTDTQQSVKTRNRLSNGRFVKGNVAAKEAGVDFGSKPENRSPGGWKKENTLSYQYNRFLNMTPAQRREWYEFSSTKEGIKTVTTAEQIGYNRVMEALQSLPDAKEIADRTEGKPKQAVEVENIDPQDKTYELLKELTAAENDRRKTTKNARSRKKPIQNKQ